MRKLIKFDKLPNLYGVKVPVESEYKIIYRIRTDETSFIRIDEPNEELITIFNGKYEQIGVITATEISFDASELVDKDTDNKNILGTLWRCYKSNEFKFHNSTQSFRSALPDEVYFDITEEQCEWCLESHKLTCDECKLVQQNITEKLLILQKQ